MFSPLIDELIQSLRILPGVGPKSAQRMALYLLERNPSGASRLANRLMTAVEQVGQCQSCRNLSEEPECGLCRNPRRDNDLLCVVESPGDVVAIEASGTFSGKYFVLHGKLSPIDGIGPSELGISALESRFETHCPKEIIIATNPTIEGEATSHYISEKARKFDIKVTRIAHGVPVGSELEYIDGSTLAHAINSRQEIQQ